MQRRAGRANDLQSILASKGGRETLRNLSKSHGFEPQEAASLAEQFPERFTLERKDDTGGRPSEILRLASLLA